jgi:mRNA interferase MazF
LSIGALGVKVVPILYKRGEVWWFDCGMVEKVRPVLIFSVPFADADRAVVTVVFHSTALRGSKFEVQMQRIRLAERIR